MQLLLGFVGNKEIDRLVKRIQEESLSIAPHTAFNAISRNLVSRGIAANQGDDNAFLSEARNYGLLTANEHSDLTALSQIRIRGQMSPSEVERAEERASTAIRKLKTWAIGGHRVRGDDQPSPQLILAFVASVILHRVSTRHKSTDSQQIPEVSSDAFDDWP